MNSIKKVSLRLPFRSLSLTSQFFLIDIKRIAIYY